MLDVRTTVLDPDAPGASVALLDLLAAVGRPDPAVERFAFVRDGEGAVGWGVAARIAVPAGDGRGAAVRSRVAEVVGATRDAVAFASLTFDPEEEGSVVVVPAVTLVRRGGRTVVVRAGGAPEGAGGMLDVVDGIGGGSGGGRAAEAPGDRPRVAGSTLRDDRWLEAVAEALATIAAGEGPERLVKVVLARDLHVWSRVPFDVDRVLGTLAGRFPSCFTFLVDGLVGASPELLLAREGRAVRSRVLAGTAPRGGTGAEDEALGAALLASEKDLREHALARTSVLEALGEVCVTLSAPDGPSLVRLENVQHLGTDVAGELADDVHVLDLLDGLHPTAAVAGTPRGPALQAIRALEGMSRGRYAGPVGWFTPSGDGEFAIALRCGVFDGPRARLFAGAGVVDGSLPELELAETWLKLRAMMGALGDVG